MDLLTKTALLTTLIALFSGCTNAGETEETDDPVPEVFVIDNFGDNTMEGHTPRGFQGQGTGLFAGDNLNSGFPDGDGVHLFLTFDLSELDGDGWQIESAILATDHASVSGTPYDDLGTLGAVEMRFASFSSALWDAEPIADGASCAFADSTDGPFSCDLGDAVQASVDDDYEYAQFRLRFDQAGDNDGSQDLATFFISDSNTDEPGIFTLTVTASR